MKNWMKPGLIPLLSLALASNADAQVLRKLKDKVDQAAADAIGKKLGLPSESSSGNSTGGTSGRGGTSSRPANKTGAGLVSKPPDVGTNIDAAELAFKGNKYSESRFALTQAILGVELKIGEAILASLPNEVAGLTKQTENDKVASSGWGWTGLTISRDYKKNDQYLGVGVQDFAYLGPMWAMYMQGGMMSTQSQTDKEQMKNIMVKGNKGIISYEESKGFTVVVMLNQSAALVWDGVNFASEDAMMAAVNSFDIDRIKKYLGEK